MCKYLHEFLKLNIKSLKSEFWFFYNKNATQYNYSVWLNQEDQEDFLKFEKSTMNWFNSAKRFERNYQIFLLNFILDDIYYSSWSYNNGLCNNWKIDNCQFDEFICFRMSLLLFTFGIPIISMLPSFPKGPFINHVDISDPLPLCGPFYYGRVSDLNRLLDYC